MNFRQSGKIRVALGLAFFAFFIAFQSPIILAADVTVVAEPGVSDVLANEFRAITARVMQFYQSEYNFVPAKSIRVIIAADELSYARVLQREGDTQEQAIRTAKSSSGVSLGAKPVIVICADKNVNYRTRIRVVTHEMFHQMQWELKGSAPAHNWLKEGSAKLSESILSEWLGEGLVAARRHELVNLLVNVKLKAEPYDMIDGGPKWTGLVEQKMYPYQVAELMSEYLMSKAGKPAFVKYFAYIGQTGNRETAFQKAFGMSHDQFVQGYNAYMVQASAVIGQVQFDIEGDVAPDIASKIKNNGAVIEQMLRSQGWNLSMSQRIILVPDSERMIKVMQRELPQMEISKLAEIARKWTIATAGGRSLVFDTGKTADPDRGFAKLALIMCRNAVVRTAHPAPVTGVYWLYEGAARMLAAKAEETAGWKNTADVRQEWINAVQKGKGYPLLTQMSSSLTPAMYRHGEDAVNATVSLAVDYLTQKYSFENLVRFFVVFRDLNDGPRAFQQVFGLTLDAFAADFDGYMKGL